MATTNSIVIINTECCVVRVDVFSLLCYFSLFCTVALVIVTVVYLGLVPWTAQISDFGLNCYLVPLLLDKQFRCLRSCILELSTSSHPRHAVITIFFLQPCQDWIIYQGLWR